MRSTIPLLALLAVLLAGCRQDPIYDADLRIWEAAQPIPAELVGTWRPRDEGVEWRIYRADGRYKTLSSEFRQQAEGDARRTGKDLHHKRELDGGARRPTRTLTNYRYEVSGARLELTFVNDEGEEVRKYTFERVPDLEPSAGSGWTRSTE